MPSDQTWKVPVTPAQRFILLQLAHGEGQKLKGQQGRVFRRFLRAFGIAAILETMDDHPAGPGKPQVNPTLASSRTPALFEVTAQNVDYALSLVDQERVPAMERTIGPLFDLLEDAKAGRLEPASGEKVPDYDPASEDWAPPADSEDPVEAVTRDIVMHLRKAGEARAAELVERGGWDAPANGAGAQPAAGGSAA